MTEDNLKRVLNRFKSSYHEAERDREFVPIDELLGQRESSEARFLEEDLVAIQDNFHDLMWYRCQDAADCLRWLWQNKRHLPKVTNELIGISSPEWFAIPGMYGGFSYGLFDRGGRPVLITDSWVKVVGGSGEQHEITPDQITLTARGFV